jgi:hypothetical protein
MLLSVSRDMNKHDAAAYVVQLLLLPLPSLQSGSMFVLGILHVSWLANNKKGACFPFYNNVDTRYMQKSPARWAPLPGKGCSAGQHVM